LRDNKDVKIYDVSLPIKNDMLVWPGDPRVYIKQKTSVAKDGVRLSMFSFSSHTGTHVDAPSHFLKNGIGVDKIPPEKLFGECIVVDLTKIDHQEILPSDIKSVRVKKGARILFKTGNYKYLHGSKFPNSYVSLSLKGAEYLAKKEVYLVGIDFLGIEKRKNPGHPVHKTLLNNGIVNVEGLDLSNVPAGKYTIVCMPLKVVDADGSPSRVFLIKE
jgi:arylformamidase